MKYLYSVLLSLLVTVCCYSQTIVSPGGKTTLVFGLTEKGEPTYRLNLGNKAVVKNSKLGVKIQGLSDMTQGFEIQKIDTCSKNETWETVWGETKYVKNNYKELKVTLLQPSGENRILILCFRLFDDGLGFRYEYPLQPKLHSFVLMDEMTEIALTGNHKVWWIPGDFDTNEFPYTTSRLNDIDAQAVRDANGISMKTLKDPNLVQTPLMMKSDDGLYINLHEAALADYPAMDLQLDKNSYTFKSFLVPDAVGNKAYLQTPCTSPWRTVIVSPDAGGILASKIILNLNEPCKLKDVSWIKPVKYVGIWWPMHVGTASWNYSDTNNIKLNTSDWKSLKPNGRHGATTENTKKYIDFAAKNGFDGVLVEGWNVGWEDWWGHWKEDVFDFVTPYPDFNVEELHKYASEKGVKMIMHHETSASVTNYERRMDEAYRFMKANGYDAVKTGYVGKIIPRGEYHDGQWMVNHYIRVAQKTADYKIMLDAHEPVRPTGLQRTYPNWLACEAARGMEYNAWSEGNRPDHETILPFTRLMGGPMDYTPGIFQIKLDYYNKNKKESIHTTLAKQLALYVTLYSPLQMAADLPENYERFSDAFQFIKDVPVDWFDTKILEAEPGDYLTIARKARTKDEWYIGAITNENPRMANIDFSYLTPDKKYVATVYSDAKDADWDKNPMVYKIEKFIVTADSKTRISLAPGGGAAVSIKPAVESDIKEYKRIK
jgi:hypothetical protein